MREGDWILIGLISFVVIGAIGTIFYPHIVPLIMVGLLLVIMIVSRIRRR